jgi:hypothetical protein
VGAHSAPARRRRGRGTAGVQPQESSGRRNGRTTVAAAAVLGTLLSVSAVWMNSYAAFTAQTDNPGNQWAAGTVTLSDNDSGAALFNATGIVPGHSLEKCITVTYSGTVPSTVRLYEDTQTAFEHTNGLGDALTVKIEEGSLTTADDCTSFTPDDPAPAAAFTGTAKTFADTKTGHANGYGLWAPAGAATKTYRITSALGDVDNSYQGGTVKLGFRWEAVAS